MSGDRGVRGVAAVLADWRAHCPHPRLLSGAEVAAGYAVLAVTLTLLVVGNALGAGILLGVWVLAMGSPLPAIIPAARLLRAAAAEARRRTGDPR